MQFKFFLKRVFFVGPRPKEIRTMLSLTPNAHKALSQIATDSGETIQKVIYDILEQALAAAVVQGIIAAPDMIDVEDGESTTSGRAV